MSSTTNQVNEDWRSREVIELVQLNMLKMVSFVNNFDASARAKLSELNEKVTQLERSLQMAESAVATQRDRGESIAIACNEDEGT